MLINRDYYHILGWEECPFCESAISLLADNGLDRRVDYVEKGSEVLTEAQERNQWDTVPMITRVRVSSDGTITQKFIGGFTDLESYLRELHE